MQTLAVCRWVAGAVLALLRDVFLSRWGAGAPRPLLATTGLWIAVVAACLVIDRGYFRKPERPLTNDCHANRCLEIAIHRQRFGCLSHIRYQCDRSQGEITEITPDNLVLQGCISGILPDDPSLLSQRLQDLPERCTDSMEEYTSSLIPLVNNENGLMLLDRAVLWLWPDITLANMIRAHAVLKFACLAVFVFFLLRAGFSPVLSLATLHVALLLVWRMNGDRPISLYPFMLPVLLLLIGLLGLTLSLRLHRRWWQHVPALVVVGLVAAFLTNLRSSYLPVAVAVMAVYLVVVALDRRRAENLPWRRVGLATLLALVCLAGGYQLFTAAFITPIEKGGHHEPFGAGRSYHVVAHPIVLWLATPPNALAEREGIIYDDSCGRKLAQRMDPTVTHLSKNYERALWAYYAKLWLLHTEEMGNLYKAKFRLAAASAAEAAPAVADGRQARLLGILALPLRLVAHWRLFLVLFAALAAVPPFLTGRLTAGRAFALAALAAAGLLLFLEQALMPANFLLAYNAFVYFWIVFVGLLCYQALADGTECLLRCGWRRWLLAMPSAAEAGHTPAGFVGQAFQPDRTTPSSTDLG